MCFHTLKNDETWKKKFFLYIHAYIWPSKWQRQLKFGQHIANNLSWHHVKFYGNVRCVSRPYLTTNLPKKSKIADFLNLLVNISICNGPSKLNFGGHLGNMLYYLHVNFCGNLRSLSGSYFTLNMKNSKIVFGRHFLGNMTKMSKPRNMKFGGPLGDMGIKVRVDFTSIPKIIKIGLC